MSALQEIQSALSFSNKVISKSIKIEEDSFRLLNNFLKKYEEQENKLPYHINLIDLLHADEKAHSRILGKLLKQKSPNKKFEILESFANYLLRKSINNFDFEVTNPIITVEKQRIDLLVKEPNKYALIIENKIHNAGDQGNQLARYIEKCFSSGFKYSQIYVVYLTNDGTKRPDDSSWESPNGGKSYKEDFKDRFLELSYKNDILPWIKESVIPNCRVKDTFLYSALEQYVDHLEGRFNLRLIDKKMNKELQEFIRKELGLNNNHNENRYILSEKRETLQNVLNQIMEIETEELINELKERLGKDYPNYNWDCKRQSNDYIYVYTELKKEDKRFDLRIACLEGSYYYGIGIIGKSEEKIKEWLEKHGIEKTCDDPETYYLEEDKNFETIYDKFRDCMNRVIGILKVE
jgi:predicted SprT family Zn-dependent metalloprotease